jgi:hypothetical protein
LELSLFGGLFRKLCDYFNIVASLIVKIKATCHYYRERKICNQKSFMIGELE